MWHGINSLGRVLFAIFASLVFSLSANAKVQVSTEVGWGDRFRPGRWTPVFVTLTGSSPQQVVLELYAPTDRRYAMKAYQSLAIGPSPVTVPLYLPLSYQLDESSITVRDANSDRRLESTALSDTPAFGGSSSGPTPVDVNMLFIGVSGNGEGERMLEGQLKRSDIEVGYLKPSRLPVVSVGYESLDLLMLNQPDLGRMSIEQQRAIADWIRAGGLLVIWPGPEPVPVTGPIVEILPCTIGENRTYDFDAKALHSAGLPARFAKLKGRALNNRAPDAREMPLFGSTEAKSLRRWVGFGQVMVLPVDVSTLVFNSEEHPRAFWRSTLAGMVDVPEKNQPNQMNYWQSAEDPRRAAAVQRTLNWISDVPGAGRFGFSYLAMVLIAMMIVVGPVDWFVLKWLGKQPWTWVTMTGWIGLVTLAAIYTGHIFKSGDLYFHTASVIDEAGGSRTAAVDLAGIYSPRTTEYNLTTERDCWWRPTSEMNVSGVSGLQVELRFHQDYEGNRPLPLLINVWNLRFLESVDYVAAAPMIDAKLSISGDSVVGVINNRSPVPLSNVYVQTGKGLAKVQGVIEPGAAMQVSAKLDPRGRPIKTKQSDVPQPWQIAQEQSATTRPASVTLGDLAFQRTLRIGQILTERDDVACISADFQSAPSRITLDAQGANAGHVNVVRSLVPLNEATSR